MTEDKYGKSQLSRFLAETWTGELQNRKLGNNYKKKKSKVTNEETGGKWVVITLICHYSDIITVTHVFILTVCMSSSVSGLKLQLFRNKSILLTRWSGTQKLAHLNNYNGILNYNLVLFLILYFECIIIPCFTLLCNYISFPVHAPNFFNCPLPARPPPHTHDPDTAAIPASLRPSYIEGFCYLNSKSQIFRLIQNMCRLVMEATNINNHHV